MSERKGGRAGATRRCVLAAASALAFGIATRDARAEPADERPKPGDLLVRVDGAQEPLTSADISIGEKPIAAWPMDPAGNVVRNGSRLNKLLVLRLDPSTLNPDTHERAAEGVVAYSAICPHAGCDANGWSAEKSAIECPCHSSHYDPREGGAIIDGPTTRPLPALPLKIVGGKLAVAKPFTSRPGITQN